MAIDLKTLSRSRAIAAPRMIIFGLPGVDKSNFAASAPNVIYQACEDICPIESTFLPYGESYDMVLDNLKAVYQQEHGFSTYVLDSLSALERLVFAKVCENEGKTSIDEFPYGRGLAQPCWRTPAARA